ncbi:hypothetical protein ASE17_06240 [Phenylobacterium sp. Root77]|jgi:hypothetical protein|uniref:hypothetical protein n=1 Tax=unclassified Phenylobacterium TaxID=2640670 RepID=UPI0006F52BBB|nr:MULTISPECIES: hypothetical protein [unclassified Phenylobacterium]KQW66357.1 hypothetical protein ASC73_18385 [Phenylobacterium sp. Root1277]KQW88864.1 hypothetical protein ASC79_19290 [Phenylobacterium sp. Root1290]KRC42283.1 hypothetical protein ASE17_06240 [Phenylobacterium sp. Root77]
MFLSALAAAVISTSYAAPAPTVSPVVEPVAQAVLVDCQVSGANLTDCKALDADGAPAAEAVKLAAQVEVPEAFALANPGRIVIKMNVTP